MTKAIKKVGRPNLQGSADLDIHLLETAARLFTEHGYEGTSMDQIAAAAGAGKQSLYRRYANKSELMNVVFSKYMLKERIDRWREHLASMSATGVLEIREPLDELRRISELAFNFMLEPKTIAVFALLVAEGRRFPNLRQEIDQLSKTLENQIARRIAIAQDRRLLRRSLDPHTSKHLVALIVSWPLVQCLMNTSSFDTPAKRKAYFKSAWEAFLHSKANEIRP